MPKGSQQLNEPRTRYFAENSTIDLEETDLDSFRVVDSLEEYSVGSRRTVAAPDLEFECQSSDLCSKGQVKQATPR